MKVAYPFIVLIVDIPIFILIGKNHFRSLSVFWPSAKWLFIPDLFSLFRGWFFRDYTGENKIGLYYIKCLVVYGITFVVFQELVT